MGLTGSKSVDLSDEGLAVVSELLEAGLLGEESLATAQAETGVDVGEVESALGSDLGEEVAQPGEKEHQIGEDDEKEEEPLPFVRHLI